MASYNCQCMMCDPQLAMSLDDLGLNPDPPHITCRAADLWRNSFTTCCCLLHGSHSGDPQSTTKAKDNLLAPALPCVKIQLNGPCSCPKCCYRCIDLPIKDPLRCKSCTERHFRYTVCKHQRGKSGNYDRCKIWQLLTIPSILKEPEKKMQ